jgi:hypothetical protein
MGSGVTLQAVDGRFPTSASLSFNSNGSNTLITGVSGQIIRVYRILLYTTTAVTVQFFDGATALTGVMSLPATGQFILPMDGNPWFIMSAGNSFNCTLGGAVVTAGKVDYTQIQTGT